MKRLFLPLLILFILIITGLASFRWWKVNSEPASQDSEVVDFLILKGRSAMQVGEKLYGEGLIKNPLAFKIYIQVTGKAEKIQSGEFQLSPSFSLPQVVERLLLGPTELWVTVPEGLRYKEYVEIFVETFGMRPERAEVFKNEFLETSKNYEGYLFPDTYLFPKDVSAALVTKKLRQTFDQKISNLDGIIAKSGFSLSEIVTMASIIERETKTDEERPIVAGLLYKRREAGWPLQADATVQYAASSAKCKVQSAKCEWWPLLTKDDLEIKSAYNSYKYTGLPPTPIANPGFSSLKAAASPQESDYWFYIHDPEGNIHYARTIFEHNTNIKKYLGK